MKKQGKELALRAIKELNLKHDKIKNNLEKNLIPLTCDLLTKCQNSAIELGTFIEKNEGEGFITVTHLEEYCEIIFQTNQLITSSNPKEINPNNIYKKLNKSVIKIENSIKNDIHVRKEAVFLPYKASMWDSLESIWMAADADQDCDAYVIPIPYMDRNPDGSIKATHYEGDMYPDNVPITKYDEFDFDIHKPDMIFIHNPYDGYNTVTTVHPFFYSDNLKKYTSCLVYVPYFATAGEMGEGQAFIPSYLNANYIVIQSENIRKYYDARIPNEKFLAFGSPKFDSVIRKCQNPPELQEEWKNKIYKEDGTKKKVYFYNTSISGMLANTDDFLKKMEYVFNTFREREDVCLLWRPHPLLDSTFDSMRKQYKPRYEELKKSYIEENIGIFDETPSIENTIANSDVYIGDAGTSVTSLFGVGDKPLFIFNNRIHKEPDEDDWRYEYFYNYRADGMNRFCITQGNKLYYSPNNDFKYEYFCDLSEYATGGYYANVIEYKEKVFVFPGNAQDVLVIDKNKRIKKISLKNEIEHPGAFAGASYYVYNKKYAFIWPNKYPALIRLNMEDESFIYINGFRDFNVGDVDGERIIAPRWFYKGKLYALNPQGNKLLSVDIETTEIRVEDTKFNCSYAAVWMSENDANEIWLFPLTGATVTRYNQETKEIKTYDLMIDGLASTNPGTKELTTKRYFGSAAMHGNEIIFAPQWGNKFVALDLEKEKTSEWESPFYTGKEDLSVYAPNWGVGGFGWNIDNPKEYYFLSNPERKSYRINLDSKEIEEIKMEFNKEEMAEHEPGFATSSQWMQYNCYENSFNSLKDLLDENICGGQFNKEKQLAAFAKMNAAVDGKCGEKVYQFIKRI